VYADRGVDLGTRLKFYDIFRRLAAETEEGRRRCEIPKQPPTGEGEPPGDGWLVDGGSYWGERLCGHMPPPWALLRFTPDAYPPPGSRLELLCLHCTETRTTRACRTRRADRDAELGTGRIGPRSGAGRAV